MLFKGVRGGEQGISVSEVSGGGEHIHEPEPIWHSKSLGHI